MKFLKATATDGETEYFNLDKILTLRPNKRGDRVKILLGAGFYWDVLPESIEIVELSEIIKK